MKRNHYFLLFILLGFFFSVQASDTVRASDTVFIRETQIRLDAEESKFLNEVVLDFSKSTPQHDIQSVKLYYGGTEALQHRNKKCMAPVEYISSFHPGTTLSANPSYSVKCAEVVRPSNKVVLKSNYKLFPGVNFFWIKRDFFIYPNKLWTMCGKSRWQRFDL